MKLEIRLFAMLREALQTERITVELPEGATVATLRRAIAEAYPPLVPFLPTSRVAAALRFVPDHYELVLGDELALVPPVSGG
ncbi:ThiS family protein [compost metagenome]